ncbi:MAG TPA: M48 family metallopeptidase, partial [Parasegetibacter sp.]
MPDVKVAAEFKQNAAKSILAIILFIICYLVISAIVVALAFMFVYLGLKIVESGRFGALSLLGGLSAIAVACFLLFFIIKFIFKRSKKDLSGLKLVSAEEQPELFRLIHEIVAATNTSMPKRVYLSADVNASVFYDSSFWSMFLPVKKNLMIGLALVNSVTANEFKAILAHEFGHFSQRSMKVGSYVYQVNQIIYNLLYDNDSYFQAFNRFAKLHAFFAIGIKIGFSVIQGVQWVLRKIYGIVNLQYMALSREMEFHADAIAAHVTGSKPLGDSLLRLNLANQSFDELLNFYDQKKNDNIKTLNFFPQHGCIMEEKAKLFNLPIVNHLPFVTVESIKKLNKSRLNIKDQWASHPDDFDRIEKLDELHITHQPDDR